MKKLTLPEKRCGNCRYYLQHYAKNRTRYLNVHCGHCLNKNAKYSRKDLHKDPHFVCEYWEDAAIKTEERRRDIKEALIDMAERLDELTEILKDDIKISQP